ncbi:MAG TPA: FISUMP domain-containing protein, partial [Saprospiraceae bacterium]|nr:FISUMP domain-containing protein [Saprospiraceae bacterium]
MKRYISTFFMLLISLGVFAQVGINTITPNAKAALDINSTSKGVLLPRMSQAQRDAIPDPIPPGLLIYCNDCGPHGEIQVFDGESWTNLSGNPVAPAPFICGTSKVSFQYNGTTVKYGTVVGAGGRCWLDRNLGASQVASTVDDAQGFGHLFQWGRRADGHQLTSPLPSVTNALSNSDLIGHGMFILPTGSPLDWRSPQNANLWQGEMGTNNPCPNGFRIPTQLEFDSERLSWITNDGAGAFASPLKLTFSGQRNAIDGNIYQQGTNGHYWLSTISPTHNHITRYLSFHQGAAGIFQLARAAGMAVRCIKDTNTPGSIGSLNCSRASIIGTITEGVVASGVSAMLSYINGNGQPHSGQTVLSSGISGLTATLITGTFANGSGSLTYTITGTPATDGIAEFALNIGGQNCTLSIPVASASFTCGVSTVTFTYNGGTVTYGTVVGAGNRCWLDRNLGASQVATSSTDAAAYGDLFQWGRGDDGHQIRTSN